MKWTKFPSDDMLTKKILSQCEAIKGINNIPDGLEIAYYLLYQGVKEKKRRKHNETSRVTKVHC